jgi:hypothetical protein
MRRSADNQVCPDPIIFHHIYCFNRSKKRIQLKVCLWGETGQDHLPLDPQDQQQFSDQIEEDSGCGESPNKKISQEIDLSMIFSPTNKRGRTNQHLDRSKQ